MLSLLSTRAPTSWWGCRSVLTLRKAKPPPAIPRGKLGAAQRQVKEAASSAEAGSTSSHFILSDIELDPNFNPPYKTVPILITQWLSRSKLQEMATEACMDKNAFLPLHCLSYGVSGSSRESDTLPPIAKWLAAVPGEDGSPFKPCTHYCTYRMHKLVHVSTPAQTFLPPSHTQKWKGMSES